MKKQIKNLVLSFFISLVLVALAFPFKTISGYAISDQIFLIDFEKLIFPFFLIFISCFLVLENFIFGPDSLQSRLQSMEAQRPSATQSRKGLLGRMRDMYYFSTRKTRGVGSNQQTDLTGYNPAGFPELYSADAKESLRNLDPQIKEIIISSAKSLPHYSIEDAKKRGEFIETTLKEIEMLKSRFTAEDTAQILRSSSGQSIGQVKLSAKDYLGRQIYSTGKISSPRQLIAVHKTDYFPENGRIRTTGNSTYTRHDLKSRKKSDSYNARQTVSFSLNHPVEGSLAGKWDDKKYAILLPVENIVDDSLVNLSATDSFAFGDVPLKGKGAEIIISKKAHRTMSPREIERLKRRTGAEIITFQSKDDSSLDEAIGRRISERGYDQLEPGFYDEFRNSIDKNFKREIEAIAEKHGKTSTMHAWTPSGKLEERIRTVNTAGRKYPYEGNQFDHSEHLEKDLSHYQKDVENARKGKPTPRDSATFRKLREVVSHADKLNDD